LARTKQIARKGKIDRKNYMKGNGRETHNNQHLNLTYSLIVKP